MNIPRMMKGANRYDPRTQNLAGKGFRKAINDDEGLRQGVTTYQGHITSKPVAKGLDREYTSIDELA